MGHQHHGVGGEGNRRPEQVDVVRDDEEDRQRPDPIESGNVPTDFGGGFGIGVHQERTSGGAAAAGGASVARLRRELL